MHLCIYISLPESKKTVRLRHRDFPRPFNAATLTSQEAWQEGAMEGKPTVGTWTESPKYLWNFNITLTDMAG